MALLCRIVWAEHYQSFDEPFEAGNFSYPAEHGTAAELMNFADFDGYVHGFVEGRDARIRIENLGANRSDEYVNGITVIWCARNKALDRLFVVGWYRNATIFRNLQYPTGRLRRRRRNMPFYIRARAEDAYLIPPSERFLEVPTKQAITDKGFIGQKNWFYVLQKAGYAHFLEAFGTYAFGGRGSGGGHNRAQQRDSFQEGQRRYSELLLPVRNPQLVAEAKRRYGYKCMVCSFDFEERYGEIGRDFVEVHHLVPLRAVVESRRSTVADVCVLCSNCHSMVHRRSPPLTPQQLTAFLRPS